MYVPSLLWALLNNGSTMRKYKRRFLYFTFLSFFVIFAVDAKIRLFFVFFINVASLGTNILYITWKIEFYSVSIRWNSFETLSGPYTLHVEQYFECRFCFWTEIHGCVVNKF